MSCFVLPTPQKKPKISSLQSPETEKQKILTSDKPFTLLICLLHNFCSNSAFLFVCCRVFGDDIQGRDCGDEASRWLTRYLGAEKTFRLVHFEPQMRARRSVDSEPLFPQYEVNTSLCCSLFPDFNSIISMLLLQTSIVVLYVRFDSLLIEIATSFTTFIH